MDFYRIHTKVIDRGQYKGWTEISPDFVVGRSKDLMIRGRSFYAIWDEKKGLWSTDEYDVQRLVDEELHVGRRIRHDDTIIKPLKSFESQGWTKFRKYIQNLSDNSHQLDQHLTFANSVVKKSDYVSRRLPYSLEPGNYSAWDELVGTLYSVEERTKIEWAIGSIVAGDSSKIQKFMVFYGPPASGKSTIMNVIQKLFDGYVASFDAKALGSNNGTFAMEVFRSNPLVAIQQDGDLSKIEDNTKLNSIIAHELMTINEKYKSSYTARVNAFLFMGTNQPVKISDAKSGIIRRLIDVHPTGVKIPTNRYFTLMSQIDFELGAIAHHCLEVYQHLGKNHYNSYKPLEMMFQTDIFFNFVEANFDIFKAQDGITLKQAYVLYKEYCSDTGIERPIAQYKLREELRNYFDEFKDRAFVDGKDVRSYYSGFNAVPFKKILDDGDAFSLVMDETTSIFDKELESRPAQYATEEGMPVSRWANVVTKLSDIDTSKIHYVQVPNNHIVIDFDLRDSFGNKSLEANLQAASVWPATYAELSKSEAGVHLHYIYDGDTSELASEYSAGIEVKVYSGNGALRRKLTKCNNVPIAHINNGLPIKEKKMLSSTTIKSERGLRELIERNLRKDIHPGTKPSIDFIHKILEDAYDSGMIFDVTDLRPRIIAFANNSTNQSMTCLKIVQTMKFKGSEDGQPSKHIPKEDQPMAIFDVEVFPNLFVVCWSYEDSDIIVKMINPSPREIEALFELKLVGFNNRRYDNHILYGRYLGRSNEQLYKLSQSIVNNERKSMYGEAYDLSYADIYDFSSVKESLKKFQIMLGIPHVELGLPWDQPVPDELISKVVEYCANDVRTTKLVLKDREQDLIARKILSELSGLTVNDTTQKHTARIIFGQDRNPQEHFVYTDLSSEFPGYTYEFGKSSYLNENPGEGGYVYAEPGIYEDVALLDVESMHPTTIEVLNLFGKYTSKFSDLKRARLAIKHGDYDAARIMMDGALKPYLEDESNADALSTALKLVINSVYGYTSAKFDNPFRDIRNKDNIVAKRGALFMINLKKAVQDQGFTVAHIKTDSIKIPNATPYIIKFVKDFGRSYGYTFQHEATYDKMCLANDAVYIAKKSECLTNCWSAVGAQFQHPYVFKTLFSHEPIQFEDYCETKQVSKGAIYLDFDAVQKPMYSDKGPHFIGKIGRFVPVLEKSGGGILQRINEEKAYAVAGTKGYLWIEYETAKAMGDELEIDMSYFDRLVDEARKAIDKFGDVDIFIK